MPRPEVTLTFCGDENCLCPKADHKQPAGGYDNLTALAEHFGVSPEELVDGRTLNVEGVCSLTCSEARGCIGGCNVRPLVKIQSDQPVAHFGHIGSADDLLRAVRRYVNGDFDDQRVNSMLDE